MNGLILPGPRTLALHSCDCQDIANAQFLELSAFELNQANDVLLPYAASHPKVRLANSPRYNCHGLVFACRRTGIYDVGTCQQILKDDRHREVSKVDLLPGDIVLYFRDGDIEHSGVVLKTDDILPLVLSKWGKGPEVIHWLSACPYNATNVKYYRITHGQFQSATAG